MWTNDEPPRQVPSYNQHLRCPSSGYISWLVCNQMTTSQSFSWVYCCPEKPGSLAKEEEKNGQD